MKKEWIGLYKLLTSTFGKLEKPLWIKGSKRSRNRPLKTRTSQYMIFGNFWDWNKSQIANSDFPRIFDKPFEKYLISKIIKYIGFISSYLSKSEQA